ILARWLREMRNSSASSAVENARSGALAIRMSARRPRSVKAVRRTREALASIGISDTYYADMSDFNVHEGQSNARYRHTLADARARVRTDNRLGAPGSDGGADGRDGAGRGDPAQPRARLLRQGAVRRDARADLRRAHR